MTDKPELSVKIGNWFDAQANTKFGVVALVVVLLVILLLGGGVAQFTGAVAAAVRSATEPTPANVTELPPQKKLDTNT
jgi:hypothetical protein